MTHRINKIFLCVFILFVAIDGLPLDSEPVPEGSIPEMKDGSMPLSSTENEPSVHKEKEADSEQPADLIPLSKSDSDSSEEDSINEPSIQEVPAKSVSNPAELTDSVPLEIEPQQDSIENSKPDPATENDDSQTHKNPLQHIHNNSGQVGNTEVASETKDAEPMVHKEPTEDIQSKKEISIPSQSLAQEVDLIPLGDETVNVTGSPGELQQDPEIEVIPPVDDTGHSDPKEVEVIPPVEDTGHSDPKEVEVVPPVEDTGHSDHSDPKEVEVIPPVDNTGHSDPKEVELIPAIDDKGHSDPKEVELSPIVNDTGHSDHEAIELIPAIDDTGHSDPKQVELSPPVDDTVHSDPEDIKLILDKDESQQVPDAQLEKEVLPSEGDNSDTSKESLTENKESDDVEIVPLFRSDIPGIKLDEPEDVPESEKNIDGDTAEVDDDEVEKTDQAKEGEIDQNLEAAIPELIQYQNASQEKITVGTQVENPDEFRDGMVVENGPEVDEGDGDTAKDKSLEIQEPAIGPNGIANVSLTIPDNSNENVMEEISYNKTELDTTEPMKEKEIIVAEPILHPKSDSKKDDTPVGESKGNAEKDSGFQWPILVAALIAGLVCFVLGLIVSACYHKSPSKRSRDAEYGSKNGQPHAETPMLSAVDPGMSPQNSPSNEASLSPDTSEPHGAKMPVNRSHTFPKMQRKTFYDSRELSYIDDVSDEDEALALGRPPNEGYERRKKLKKKNLKKRLSKLFDGLEDPVMSTTDKAASEENFSRVVENFRRSMIESDQDSYTQPEPEVTEKTKLLDSNPSDSNNDKANNDADEKLSETNGLQATGQL